MRRQSMSQTVGSLAAVVLCAAACSKSKEPAKQPPPQETVKEPVKEPPKEPAKDQVEVFSWWTGAGEQEGLDAMIADFKKKNPNIEVVNAAVSGGAGTNAKAILANRLQAGNPPDSYQRHAGLELADDIKASKLEDLTKLYEAQGWKDKLPKGLLEAITIDGKVYSVPVNIHRANLIWFTPKTLKALGIAGPPKTWKEFLTQAATIKGKGKTALAIGPAWTQKHLLETVLLGELGPDKYTGLWNGKTDWKSAEVTAADFQSVLPFHSPVYLSGPSSPSSTVSSRCFWVHAGPIASAVLPLALIVAAWVMNSFQVLGGPAMPSAASVV